MITMQLPKSHLERIWHFPNELSGYIYYVSCPTSDMVNFMSENAQHPYEFDTRGFKNENEREIVTLTAHEQDMILFKVKFGV